MLERDGAGLNLCDDVRDGILCHSGRAPMPRTLEGRIVRLVDRVAYINHDIDDAVRAGRPAGGRPARRAHRRPGNERARRGSTRSSTTSSSTAPWRTTSCRARARARRWTSCARSCSSASTWGEAARREHAKIERVVGTLFAYYAEAPSRLPDAGGASDADEAQRVTDYLAGMTDRFCIRAFEALAVPESFAA